MRESLAMDEYACCSSRKTGHGETWEWECGRGRMVRFVKVCVTMLRVKRLNAVSAISHLALIKDWRRRRDHQLLLFCRVPGLSSKHSQSWDDQLAMNGPCFSHN